MAKGSLGVHAVMVPTADPLALQEPFLLELHHDALRGPLGDPDPFGDVAEPHIGLGGDAQEHVGMVGEKGPIGCGAFRRFDPR
jgi:hypothetical protein